MAKFNPRQKVGSGNLRSQADKDKESKDALSKSGPGQKARAIKNLREYNKADMESYKLDQKKF